MIGVKTETIKKIALAAIGEKKISREALAGLTGLSTMTLGKAIPALVESGLFEESRAPISRGRHASLLSPSSFPVTLSVIVTESLVEAVANDLSGEVLASAERPYNHSLEYKENIDISMRELFYKAEIENRIASSATVCLSSKTELCGSNTTLCAEELLCDVMSELYGDVNVMHVLLLDQKLCPLVFSHGNLFTREGSREISAQSTRERAEKIARLVAAMHEYSRLNQVIIEGSYDEEELIYLVKDMLAEKHSFKKKDMPQITYYKKYSFIKSILSKRLAREHVIKICDLFFVEQ